MKKFSLRVVATLMSAMIIILSLSVMSASAAETTSTDTSASSNASEYVFTDADLNTFRHKLKLYLISINGQNNAEVKKTILGEYLIRKDYQKDLTHGELEVLARQLDFYFATKEFLKRGIVKHRFPGVFDGEKVVTYTFPSDVINSVVKFPKDVAIHKLPDEKHPKGLVIFRDCIPRNTNDPIPDATLCQTARYTIKDCFIQMENDTPEQKEKCYTYWKCDWELHDNVVAGYKEKYGDYSWLSVLQQDFSAIFM